MAEEKKSKGKEDNSVVLERVYNVPLRKEWLKSPKYKRAKKAILALKQFMVKHMKSEDVKLSTNINLLIWKHGIKNPPHHIKVKAVKRKDDSVFVELDGVALKEKVPSILKKSRAKFEAKEKKKKAAEPKVSKTSKVEDVKEEVAEEAKEIQKEEIKELEKEAKIPKKQEHAPKKEIKENKVQAHPNAPAVNKF